MDFETQELLKYYMFLLKTQHKELRDILLLEDLVLRYDVNSILKERDSRIVKPVACIEHAVDALFDINCKDPLNTKEVNIYPGFLLLDNNHVMKPSVIELVDAINKTKKTIALFLDIHNKPKKVVINADLTVKLNPILFEHYPMINPSQLFRKINLVNKVARKVKLSWSRRQRYDKYSPEKAIGIVTFNYDKPPALDISPNRWRYSLDKFKTRLEGMNSDVRLTRIKSSPPVPVVSCSFIGQKKWDYFHGNNPLILFTDSNEEALEGENFEITGRLRTLEKWSHINSEELTEFGWKPICKELDFYVK